MALSARMQPHFYTPEQYLEMERKAETKSEYLDGYIVAMAGGSPKHAAITINVGGELRTLLRGSACRAFSSDLRVRSTPSGNYTYPDVTVVCGELHYHDAHEDVVTNPTLVVEVLSPSTAQIDRGTKLFQYRQIESLRGYLIVAQDEPFVDLYSYRNGDWILTSAYGLDASLYIPALDCTLSLAETYAGIVFPEPGPDSILAGERSAE